MRVPTHSFASDGEIVESLFEVAFENDRLGRRGPNEGFWVRFDD